MKEFYKQKWIADLRSDKYAQGKNVLKTKDHAYCCLGVLCEIVRQEHPDLGEWELDESGEHYLLKDMYEYLPREVTEIVGELDLGDEELTESRLAEFNDQFGYSFKQIADIIESGMDPEFHIEGEEDGEYQENDEAEA